jgi:hypothetical protein
MDLDTVLSYMRLLAGGLKDASNLFMAQPAFSRALRMAGGLIDVATVLIERGVADPVQHITRLVDLDAELDQIRAEEDAAAKEQFADKP